MSYKFDNEESLKAFIKENVLTRREAEKYLNINSKQNFTRALKNGKFKSLKTVGEGNGQVQLFFKSDLEDYKKAKETDLKKYIPRKGDEY